MFFEIIDFTILESSSAFIRWGLGFQRPKTSLGGLRGTGTIREEVSLSAGWGLVVSSNQQHAEIYTIDYSYDLRNWGQCGTASRSIHLELHLFICNVLVLFHRLVLGGDQWQLGFSSYYHVLDCFFDGEKPAYDNIYFLLSLYLTHQMNLDSRGFSFLCLYSCTGRCA